LGAKKKIAAISAVVIVGLLVYVALTAPTANMTASSASVGKGVTVFFSGEDSVDPVGRIVSYEWDFGDGGKAEGVDAEHSYVAGGTYRVTLKVTDDTGLTDMAEAEVEVFVLSPQVEVLVEDTEVRVGEIVVFDAGNSGDPDGEILSFEWQFGDGATGEGMVAEHAYQEEGFFAVSLTVVDDDGLSNSTTVRVRVSPREYILAQAIEESIVRADITGLGAYNLLRLDLQSLVPFKVNIAIPRGTVFLSRGDYPSMVYLRLLGIYKGYDFATQSIKYEPAFQIALESSETESYVVTVYCLGFGESMPYSSSLFDVGGPADPDVMIILEAARELPDETAWYEAVQAAIWVATGDVTKHELTESFQIEEEDIENARVVLETAFGEVSIYVLSDPLDLVDAVDRGLIEVEFRGTGACAGEVIELKVTLNLDVSVDIETEPGLILVNSGVGQNMIVAEEDTLTVKVEVELEVEIEAYCLDSHKANPSDEETLHLETDPGTYGEVVVELMQSLRGAPSERRSVKAVQIALWVVTDDVSRDDIRFYFSEQDVEDAGWLLENAGIDISGKRLFQE